MHGSEKTKTETAQQPSFSGVLSKNEICHARMGGLVQQSRSTYADGNVLLTEFDAAYYRQLEELGDSQKQSMCNHTVCF
jgi:hypothetical protein